MSIEFDDLKEKARDLAQTGVARAKEFTDVALDKGKQLAEIGKLKVQNISEQDAIKRAYTELGKQYYTLNGISPDPALAGLCEKIGASQARIEYNKERIADMMTAAGITQQEVEDAACDCCCEDGCCSVEPDEPEEPGEDAPAKE